MAASSLGASNTQFLSLKLDHKTKLCMPFPRHGIQAVSRPKAWRHAGVMVTRRSNKALVVCHSQSSLIAEKEPAAASKTEEEGEKKSFSDPVSKLIPNTVEVEFLLTEICDTTSIAEFELKLNGFHLHVRRALSGGIAPHPSYIPGPASITADSAAEVPASNGSVSTSSLAISKVGSSEGDAGTLLERAADEGYAIIQSPKVGFFRRSRTIKGKRAPPSCKEKQLVKEGQVICYIEQLGGEIPVESDVSGEVVRILREDGEPVGYGDAIIAILPSFPGIKKLPS